MPRRSMHADARGKKKTRSEDGHPDRAGRGGLGRPEAIASGRLLRWKRLSHCLKGWHAF